MTRDREPDGQPSERSEAPESAAPTAALKSSPRPEPTAAPKSSPRPEPTAALNSSPRPEPTAAPKSSPRPEENELDVEAALRPTILPRTLDARELLGDGRVLHIEHAGEIYTLRLTRNDRLILTK